MNIQRSSRLAAALCAALVVVWAQPARAATAPVVPGYELLAASGKADAATLGQVLLGELNCASCHATDWPRITTKPAPDLSQAGARLTPQYLRAYLSDPHGVKPGATMPDLFHASEAEAKRGAVDMLVNYLVSLGGPIAPSQHASVSAQANVGKAIFERVGCVACHAPDQKIDAKVPSVPLANLAMKTTVDQMSLFLQDPLKVRRGGRMPSLHLTSQEADLLAVYLLRDQLDNPQNKSARPVPSPGLRFELYVGGLGGNLPDFDKRQPAAVGKVDQFSIDVPQRKANDDFGIRFSGNIAIPRDGQYRFFTRSDDGSQLFIDGKLVVNNDGVHPPGEKSGQVDLTAGKHLITVTFFEAGGGEELTVSWEGPQLKRQTIPANVLSNEPQAPMVPLETEAFTIDAQKAALGKQMFAAMGCASCHGVPGEASPSAAVRRGKPMNALNLSAEGGCLGEHVAKGLPKYDLNAKQRGAVVAALTNKAQLATKPTAAQHIQHTMATLNCLGCHQRDGVGGPDEARTPFFKMTGDFDMGEEGFIPPRLTGVGGKLLTEAIQRILFKGELHVRPYMATRMPLFGEPNLAGLVAALDKTDNTATALPPLKFSALMAKDGRQLVGTKEGLGCVNCHGVNGVKSPSMPAIDLGTVFERLRRPWFHRLLSNPASINPNTRMPAYWSQGQVVFANLGGGTPQGQTDAMWLYLSLGKSMPLPIGLQVSGTKDELIPVGEPIVHRTFMGGVSPRAILVGYPEMVSVAFDANAVRLALAWRGRFFDAGGMWDGRGGKHLGPLGTDVINMPPGPAFAVLEKPDAPWPTVGNQRDVGGHYLGYTLDKQLRPTLRYQLGAATIHELPLPVLKAGGATLVRRMHVTAAEDVAGLYMLAAQGAKVESAGPGAWRVDDKLTVRITGAEAVVRDADGAQQLLVPVKFNNMKSAFDVELSW